MTDAEVIQAAYEERLKDMFGALIDNAIGSSDEEKAECHLRFAKGVRTTKQLREIALAVLEKINGETACSKSS